MQNKDVRFGFKSVKAKDAAGKVILDEKGDPVMIPAPDAVTLSIPQFSTVEDLKELMESGDEKQLSLAMEALNFIIQEEAKIQLEDARREGREMWPIYTISKNEKGEEVKTLEKEADFEWLDTSKLQFDYIASLPPKTRGAAGIPDELWEGFAKDYQEVIVNHGKTPQQAKTAAEFYLKKFAPVRKQKNALEGLQKNLQVWINHSERAEEYQDVYKNLMNKLNTLLQEDENAIVAAI